VNASPSLSTTTPADKKLKTALIGEVLDIVLPPSFFEDAKDGARSAQPGREERGSGRWPLGATAASGPARRRAVGADAAPAEPGPDTAATPPAVATAGAAQTQGGGAMGPIGVGAGTGFELLYDESAEAERSRRDAGSSGDRARHSRQPSAGRRAAGPSWL
jgi:hypothetical protein